MEEDRKKMEEDRKKMDAKLDQILAQLSGKSNTKDKAKSGGSGDDDTSFGF